MTHAADTIPAVDAVHAFGDVAPRATIVTHLARLMGTTAAEGSILAGLQTGALEEIPYGARTALRTTERPAGPNPTRPPDHAHILSALTARDRIAWLDTIISDVADKLDAAGAARAITVAARAGLLEELILADGSICLRALELTA
jgi:hypothetical protein